MLTPAQLSAIDRHLRKENWLLNEALIAELTDHYIAGIEDQLAQGLPFEVAIKTIHTGFGGRKGLLKMEEEFQENQEKTNKRIIWTKIVDYFRMPRIAISLIILGVIYSLSTKFSTYIVAGLETKLVFVVALVLVSVLYVLAFIQLVHDFRQTARSKLLNNELRALIQAWGTMISVIIFTRQLYPIQNLVDQYPLLISLFMTLFVVVELAIIELLWENRYRNVKMI